MTFLLTNPFAKIISGELPAKIEYENERILAFWDINPKAKVHLLIIPKVEIITAQSVSADNQALFGEFFVVAKLLAKKLGLTGYKLHMNVGEAGGQVVPHVHFHFLSADYRSNL